MRPVVPVDRLAAERSVLRHGRRVESVERRRVARRPVRIQLRRVRQSERVSHQRVQLLGLLQVNTG